MSKVPGLLIFTIAMLALGLAVGGRTVNSAWQESAKARGAMEHNKQTGILEWKPELQRKDAK